MCRKTRLHRAASLCALLLLGVLPFAPSRAQTAEKPGAYEPDAARFETLVKPLLAETCTVCHNSQMASGGLNVAAFANPQSLAAHREGWEKIIQKVRSGEMPPAGLPKPPVEQIDALVAFVQGEFDRADRSLTPDPGRVTARRLNRNEYSNTIRDLLAVQFRAENDFPSDDSGHGFDNIGDVLTISPVLMEKYLAAAERIASAAVGADPLPDKPVEAEYHRKHRTIRILDVSTIEAIHRVEWDGEYIIRIGLPGERSRNAKPVKMAFWMDGRLLHEMMVETKPSGLVYFDPYSMEEMRLTLPAGDHVFRAGFVNDDFVNGMTRKDAHDRDKNKYLESITFVGPFPAEVEKPSRKKIFVCDANSGAACVREILAELARRAYRRPVTREEVQDLVRFVDLARSNGQTVEQGVQLAIQAMLVSPHFLFRIERDPDPANPEAVHQISGIELASRLSYFFWSSMPDDELLGLGENGTLSKPEVLAAQVDRLLADERSAALAENFAGQWLQTRALDSASPDPKKFPDWSPELREAMKAETQLFFEAMLRENRPLGEFLDAGFTFLNGPLAKHYGIEGIHGPDFRRVELTTEQRGGVLSQASVLTVTSYPTRTSPVIRGKYVLENILGAPPPAPPPDVPALDEASVGETASMREQLSQHRANPACSTCHERMDTLGFGLENYDAIGKWRTADGKFPVDSGGTLPNGRSFSTPAQMREILKDQVPEFARCLTEKMLTYALGRGLERYDNRTVREITRKLEASGYRFRSLVHEIVQSLPFLKRRGEVLSENRGTAKEIAQR
jgi:mono/diheme cytochrome c family protein